MALGKKLQDDDDYGFTDGSADVFGYGLPTMARSSRRKKSKRNKRVSKPRKHKQRKHRRRGVKRVSSKGIKFTKNGQPYRIMPNGRARFIKK